MPEIIEKKNNDYIYEIEFNNLTMKRVLFYCHVAHVLF